MQSSHVAFELYMLRNAPSWCSSVERKWIGVQDRSQCCSAQWVVRFPHSKNVRLCGERIDYSVRSICFVLELHSMIYKWFHSSLHMLKYLTYCAVFNHPGRNCLWFNYLLHLEKLYMFLSIYTARVYATCNLKLRFPHLFSGEKLGDKNNTFYWPFVS